MYSYLLFREILFLYPPVYTEVCIDIPLVVVDVATVDVTADSFVVSLSSALVLLVVWCWCLVVFMESVVVLDISAGVAVLLINVIPVVVSLCFVVGILLIVVCSIHKFSRASP